MVRLSGVVAVSLVFWGGVKFVIAQGAPDATTAARKTVINALIGLVIVIISVNVITFIGSSLY